MTQYDAHEKTIDGEKFTMYMLDPLESNDLLVDVMKMIGPAMGPVLDKLTQQSGGGVESVMDMEVNVEFFTKASESLFRELDKDVIRRIAKVFSNVTEMNGVRLEGPVLNRSFQGRLDLMYKWIFWGARVQWGGLLSVLVSGAGGQGAAEEKA